MRHPWTYALFICCLAVHAERIFPVTPAVHGDVDKEVNPDEGTQSIDLEDVTPSFDSPMANVTVKEGATAVLPCSVKFLGRRQVVWTDQWSTLLTFEDRRIIDDERLSVERPFSKDWNLHIRNVQHKDQGLYNCQINTSPVKIKTVHLKVQVPAKIIENLSSSDTTVREGETVTLVCNVTGIPLPRVTWYRHVLDKKGKERESEFCPGSNWIGVSGEVLIIHNISRYCGDIYECVAFNDVPPAINRMIKVDVQFAPEIVLPNRRIGQSLGKETILECTVTANPQAVSRWLKDGVEVKTDGSSYHVEVYNAHNAPYTIFLNVRIMPIGEQDFGHYTCEASSIMGKDAETMVLFEYKRPQTTTATSTTTTTQAPLLSTLDAPRRGFPSHDQHDPSQAQIRIFTQGPPRHTLAPPPGAQLRSPDESDVIDGTIRGRSAATITHPAVLDVVVFSMFVLNEFLLVGS